MAPTQAVLLLQQGKDAPLGMLGDQAADAVGQGRGGRARHQAKQEFQGEQARFPRVARLVEPAAQSQGAEGGSDRGGGRLAAAVADAAAFDLLGDLLGLFGLVEIVLFIVTVGFAYVYVWRRGGLDWN